MLERGAAKNINIADNEGRTALDRCEKGTEGTSTKRSAARRVGCAVAVLTTLI